MMINSVIRFLQKKAIKGIVSDSQGEVLIGATIKVKGEPGGTITDVNRGIRSVLGDNQPLYVIDGVPMLNASSEQSFTAIGGTADAGNRDGATVSPI